jgi:protein transport protein SEC20
MNAQALRARLTPLFESLKQTQQLISRLSKFPATPGSSPSNPEEGDARVELSAEIHQSLKEQEEDFELLRQEIEDQTNTSSWASNTRRRDSGREREKTDLAAQVTRLGEDLKM